MVRQSFFHIELIYRKSTNIPSRGGSVMPALKGEPLRPPYALVVAASFTGRTSVIRTL